MQLALLRICLGLFYGAIIPMQIQASVYQRLPNIGEKFWRSTSITFLGNILGPITGGFLMVTFNILVVFVFPASILLLAELVLPIVLKKIENS